MVLRNSSSTTHYFWPQNYDELVEKLSDLNEEGFDSAVLLTEFHGLYLVYCTEPLAEWFLESGDPVARMDGEGSYNRLTLNHVRSATDKNQAVLMWRENA